MGSTPPAHACDGSCITYKKWTSDSFRPIRKTFTLSCTLCFSFQKVQNNKVVLLGDVSLKRAKDAVGWFSRKRLGSNHVASKDWLNGFH